VTTLYPEESYPLWVSGGLSWGDDPSEAMRPMTALHLIDSIDRQLRRWADDDWAAEQMARGHERRWIIYDWDADEVLGHAYSTYQEARSDADELDNVIVVCLGPVAPVRTAGDAADDDE
jgi:hypothetical protein